MKASRMDWSRLVLPAVQALQPYRPGITAEKLRRERGLADICKFSSNEAPLAPSPAVQSAMREALQQANRYPDTQALLDGLAARLGIAAGGLIIGSGSIDVIEALVRTLVAAHNNVVLSEFGYCAYQAFVKERGAAVRVAESGLDFGHRVERMIAKIDAHTRMILLDSPTNLSGCSLDPADLRRLLDALPEHVVLVLDEAYVEFAGASVAADTQHLPARYPNVVVTRTFSKAYGLAGMRVGYAVADPALVQFVNRIRPPFPVSRVALAGALAALGDRAHLQQIVASAQAGRWQLGAALAAHGIAFSDSNANFILADFAGKARQVYEGLLAAGCITRAMHAYGLPNHIRISIGTGREIERLLAVIGALLSDTQAGAVSETA